MSADDLVMSLSLHGQPSEPREFAETVAALPDPVRDLRGWPGAVLGQRQRIDFALSDGAFDFWLVCEGPWHDLRLARWRNPFDAIKAGCEACHERLLADVQRRLLVTAPVAEFPAVVLSDRGSLGERTGVETERK